AGFFNEQEKQRKEDYAMVAYELNNTLSDFGTVSRGICVTDNQGWLNSVTELTKIAKTANGIADIQPDGKTTMLRENDPVSMNFWGFTPSLFNHLEYEFTQFLNSG